MIGLSFEYGTLHFSKEGYNEISKFARFLFNKRQDFLYNYANSLYKRALSLNTQKEDFFNLIAEKKLYDQYPEYLLRHDYNSDSFKVHKRDIIFIAKELYRKDNTILKPRKSVFKHLTNRNTLFCFHDVITFNKETREISINIPKKKHSVHLYHSLCLYNKLFDYLQKQYYWRENEGGEIYVENGTANGFSKKIYLKLGNFKLKNKVA